MNAQLSRVLTGIIIIMVGAAFLLGTLGLFDTGYIFGTWWPLLVVLAGLLIFLSDRKSWTWALIVAGVGVVLQLNRLEVITANPWEFFWPVVIMFVGISILFQRSNGTREHVSKENRSDVTAVLSGSDIRSATSDYRGSNITAVLGGAKLDLSKVTLKQDATITVLVFMGGVELITPKGVHVRNQTTAILGGIEDRTELDEKTKAPTLYIVGTVIMGGVEIKN